MGSGIIRTRVIEAERTGMSYSDCPVELLRYLERLIKKKAFHYLQRLFRHCSAFHSIRPTPICTTLRSRSWTASTAAQTLDCRILLSLGFQRCLWRCLQRCLQRLQRLQRLQVFMFSQHSSTQVCKIERSRPSSYCCDKTSERDGTEFKPLRTHVEPAVIHAMALVALTAVLINAVSSFSCPFSFLNESGGDHDESATLGQPKKDTRIAIRLLFFSTRKGDKKTRGSKRFTHSDMNFKRSSLSRTLVPSSKAYPIFTCR